jgi:hypothetical protein
VDNPIDGRTHHRALEVQFRLVNSRLLLLDYPLCIFQIGLCHPQVHFGYFDCLGLYLDLLDSRAQIRGTGIAQSASLAQISFGHSSRFCQLCLSFEFSLGFVLFRLS